MSYLTDKEKRLLFSALSREKEVCKQVDKESCREPYEDTLESVVKSLERKFYYDRFEKEIRNKAIEEFAERLKESLLNKWRHFLSTDSNGFDWITTDAVHTHIDELLKQMKGEKA